MARSSWSSLSKLLPLRSKSFFQQPKRVSNNIAQLTELTPPPPHVFRQKTIFYWRVPYAEDVGYAVGDQRLRERLAARHLRGTTFRIYFIGKICKVYFTRSVKKMKYPEIIFWRYFFRVFYYLIFTGTITIIHVVPWWAWFSRLDPPPGTGQGRCRSIAHLGRKKKSSKHT